MAQDGDTPKDVRQVSLGWREELAADIEGEGDVAVTRSRAAFGFHHEIDERWVLRGQIGGEHSRFDWSSDSSFLGSSRPWSEIARTGVVAQVIRELDDHWSVVASATLGAAFEPDAELDDSLTVKGYVGGAWKRDDELTLGLNVTVSSRLEDSVRILPFPVVDWRFCDKWRLVSDIGDVVEGPSMSLRRTFSEQFDLGATVFGILNDARLNDTGAAPNGVLRETRVAAGLEALWKPHRAVHISALAGFTVWGDFEVDDERGDAIDTTDLESAPVLGLSAKLYF